MNNQQDFKDGDVIVIKEDHERRLDALTVLVKYHRLGKIGYHALLNRRWQTITLNQEFSGEGRTIRLATDAEKQALFRLLATQGKTFNYKTKEIETLPSACNFDELDYVLVKGKATDKTWELHQMASIRLHQDNTLKMHMVGGKTFIVTECEFLPYGDCTRHLVGTTTEWH